MLDRAVLDTAGAALHGYATALPYHQEIRRDAEQFLTQMARREAQLVIPTEEVLRYGTGKAALAQVLR